MGEFDRAAAPSLSRWLLRAIKIMPIISDDEQRVGHRPSSSRWRLALPAHGDNKTANLKAIMAAECAAERSNRSNRSRASIRDLICLHIVDKYFRRNRVATIIIGVVAARLAR